MIHLEEQWDAALTVERLLGWLTPRQAYVLSGIHLRGRKRTEIARELGVSASAVQCLETKAVWRLRYRLRVPTPDWDTQLALYDEFGAAYGTSNWPHRDLSR